MPNVLRGMVDPSPKRSGGTIPSLTWGVIGYGVSEGETSTSPPSGKKKWDGDGKHIYTPNPAY